MNNKHYGIGEYNMKDAEGNKYVLSVKYDEVAESPVEWMTTTIVTWHKHYVIGNESVSWDDAYDILDGLYKKYVCADYDVLLHASEMMYELSKCDDIVIKMVYAYEHSGITISTSNAYQYNDRYDYYVIGFAFIEKEKAFKEFNTQDENYWRVIANDTIENDIELLDTYLQGSVYYYSLSQYCEMKNIETCPHCGVIIKEESITELVEIDSCGGFYGDCIEDNGILDEISRDLEFVD